MTTKDQAIAPLQEWWDSGNEQFEVLEEIVNRMIAQPPAPDCRTCEQYREAEGICEYPLFHGLAQCTNGDQYKEAPKVVLWRKEL